MIELYCALDRDNNFKRLYFRLDAVPAIGEVLSLPDPHTERLHHYVKVEAVTRNYVRDPTNALRIIQDTVHVDCNHINTRSNP